MSYMGSVQNIDGKVVDKYRLGNDNICVIIEDDNDKKYSVEFEDYHVKPSLSNLYGLLSGTFQGKGDSLDHLIDKDDYIGVRVNYCENPIRIGYRLNYVSNKEIRKVTNRTFPSSNQSNGTYGKLSRYK